MIEVGYLAGLSPNKRKQGSLLKLVLGGYKTSRHSRRDICTRDKGSNKEPFNCPGPALKINWHLASQ